MVDGRGAQFHPQPDAWPGGELVRVDANAQPGPPAGVEDRPGLFGVEGPDLAERVDPARVGGARRDHLLDDEVHVVVDPSRELRRRHVGGEQRGLRGVGVREPHGPLLVAHGLPVARLHLERRRALASVFGGEPGEMGVQFVVGRRPRRRDRGPDPARLVGPAGHAGRELLGPVAGEDEVTVRLDEPGQDGAPGGVPDLVARLGARARPDPDDPAVPDDDGRVPDDPEGALADGGIVRDQLADAVDEQGHQGSMGMWTPRSRATSRACA